MRTWPHAELAQMLGPFVDAGPCLAVGGLTPGHLEEKRTVGVGSSTGAQPSREYRGSIGRHGGEGRCGHLLSFPQRRCRTTRVRRRRFGQSWPLTTVLWCRTPGLLGSVPTSFLYFIRSSSTVKVDY